MVKIKASAIPELRVYIQTVTQIMYDTVEEFEDPFKGYIREQIISNRELDNSFLLLLGSGMRIEERILKIAAGIELLNLSMQMHESTFYRPQMIFERHIKQDEERNSIFTMAGDLLIYKSLQMLTEQVNYDSLKKVILCTGAVAKGELKYLRELSGHRLTQTGYIEILKQTGYINSASLHIGMHETAGGRKPPESLIIDIAAESFSIYSKLIKEVAAFKRKDFSEIKMGNAAMPLLIALEAKKIDPHQLSTYTLEKVLDMIETSGAVEATCDLADTYRNKALNAFREILPSQAVRTAEKIIDILAEFQNQ